MLTPGAIYRRHAHNEVVTQRSARTPSADMNLPPSSTYLPTPSLATLSSWNSKCHIQQIVASFEMLFYALCDTILYSSSAVAATAVYGLRGGDHLSAALEAGTTSMVSLHSLHFTSM